MGILDKIIGSKEAEKSDEENVGKKSAEKPEKDLEKKEEKGKNQAAKEKSGKTKKGAISDKKAEKKEENIAHRVLLEPVISEKSTQMGSENKYVFKVSGKAGKGGIREAVEGYYGVKVTKVNVVRILPKKRIHGRTIGYKKGFKKAIVTLREGDTIGVAEGV